MNRHVVSARTSLLAAALTLLACGGQTQRESNIQYKIQHAESPDTRQGEQLKGVLDEADVRRVFEEQRDGFVNCFKQGALESFVSGEVQLTVTVKANGRVEKAFVSRSDLGALKAEDCLLQQARYLEFPPPQNGRARFAYPLPWNPQGRRLSSLREPAYGYAVLARNRPVLDNCRTEYKYPGPYRLTLYIGQMGQVLNAGFDSPEGASDEFAACVVETARSLRFPSSGAVVARYEALMENLKDDLTPMNRDFD
jgi:hypothetical protein